MSAAPWDLGFCSTDRRCPCCDDVPAADVAAGSPCVACSALLPADLPPATPVAAELLDAEIDRFWYQFGRQVGRAQGRDEAEAEASEAWRQVAGRVRATAGQLTHDELHRRRYPWLFGEAAS